MADQPHTAKRKNGMKKIVLFVTMLAVLVVVNFLIIKKEETLASGRTMLLRLVPVDPRSLAIANEVPQSQLGSSGSLVVFLDTNSILGKI